MVLLHKLLPKLKREGRKVLIFSQVRPIPVPQAGELCLDGCWPGTPHPGCALQSLPQSGTVF